MDEPADGNFYKEEELTSPSAASGQLGATSKNSSNGVEWTASEFIERHKSIVWYLVLALVTLAIAALIYFVGHDYIAIGAVIAIGLIFGIIAARKPRTLDYKLDERGLSVGGKLYPYRHFKAFSFAHEGDFASVILLPLRRFMPIMTIYYDPAEEAKITETIGNYLPLDTHSLDPIDRFLKKIRF